MFKTMQSFASEKSTFWGKILAILIACLISASAFAQDITNTLGVGGEFKVKDAATNFLTVTQSSGQVNILKSLRLETTALGTTNGVIFKNLDRFLHSYGTYNTFLGVNSGNLTMTGDNNTGVGRRSLYVNTIGRDNTAIGFMSLYDNTEGSSNTAVGSSSLYSNTTGHYNSAVGDSSLFANTIGVDNTATGYYALRSNTSASGNTANGSKSLRYNTTGSYNTAVGYQSLHDNTIGQNNTANGSSALYNNTTGENNTALGYSTGSTITTGSNLTCIGYNAEPTSASATNQITLGNNQITSLRCNVTTITSLSDARDKKNIKDLGLGIDFLMKLKPRIYNWDKREWYENNIPDGSKMKEELTAGFIAQELDEVQTSENAEWLKLVLKDNPDKWEATPGNLLPIMVKAIQELKAENVQLKMKLADVGEIKEHIAEIENLKAELKEQIEILKASNNSEKINFSFINNERIAK